MVNEFLQFGIIIGLAATLSLIARAIRQPPLIAYLIVGLVVGPLFLNFPSSDLLHFFARLGIAFLLFIVGLSLNFKTLKDVGKVSFIAGVGTMAVVSILSYVIALYFGYSTTTALYLGAAFAFSSTVVVVKLLSDKREIDTLHGRIALGILIVENFVAAIMLILVPVIGEASTTTIILQLAKAAGLIIALFLTSWIILPLLFGIAARSSETLFLVSAAWALVVSAVFSATGLPLEIGALLAGIALASSKYALDISTKMKGLRDFFVVLFFVYFGSLLQGPFNTELIVAAITFSLFILIGKPIIIMAFMRAFGYKKRTNFFAGVGLAQISEFSLVLLLVGFTQGVISQSALTLALLVAFITLAFSSYSLSYAQPLFKALAPLLTIFESSAFDVDTLRKDKKYDIILFGYNRVGFTLIKAFERAQKSYLIVDYNPQVILDLGKRKINCVYGDAHDPELFQELRLNDAELVLSTIPDYDVNTLIRKAIHSKKTLFIPTSHTFENTEQLYNDGADYVIMPHFLGGNYVADMLFDKSFSRDVLATLGKKQRQELKERAREGHVHPSRERYGN